MSDLSEDSEASAWVNTSVAVAAVLGWTALALQLFLSMRLSLARGRGALGGLGIYFSFFTILTNILVATALTARVARERSAISRFFTRPTVITAIATSIVAVAITYTALLQNTWSPRGLQLVVDMMLHHLMPVLFVTYWWVVVPGEDLKWGQVFRWTLYPVVYIGYVMARGALSGDYPYPFIDAGAIGYPRSLVNAGGMLVGFITVALVLVAVGRAKPRVGFARTPPS